MAVAKLVAFTLHTTITQLQLQAGRIGQVGWDWGSIEVESLYNQFNNSQAYAKCGCHHPNGTGKWGFAQEEGHQHHDSK